MTALAALPRLKARTRVPLSRFAWLRVGGPADLLLEPESEDELIEVLKSLPAEMPVTVVGAFSNLLVRDGGIREAVIRLGRSLAGIAIEGDRITVGSAAMDIEVARRAAARGLAGLDFLSGIPGTIGGGLRMNAGAYGRAFADIVECVRAVDRQGRIHEIAAQELGFGYRRCSVPENLILTQAMLQARVGVLGDIKALMAEIARLRTDSQPVRARTGGSTFANPTGASAWSLIDAVGGRGLRMGGASVSEKHCNFLINDGNATAAEFEALGEELRRRVRARFGLELDWEIRRIGEPGPRTLET